MPALLFLVDLCSGKLIQLLTFRLFGEITFQLFQTVYNVMWLKRWRSTLPSSPQVFVVVVVVVVVVQLTVAADIKISFC